MQQLSREKGKESPMFSQRRHRLDEMTAELTLRSDPGRGATPVKRQPPVKYETTPSREQDAGLNGPGPSSVVPKPLVPNRTAKPFPSGLNPSPGSISSPTVPSKNLFKVPVVVSTTPHVWSPTGDIIASRDERIVVPAIKTGILPDVKRRGANKKISIEPAEDDCFGLGAEASNFMQTSTVRQKNPPPVLPKPSINMARPPWSARSPGSRSPIATSTPPPRPATKPKPKVSTATQPVSLQHGSGRGLPQGLFDTNGPSAAHPPPFSWTAARKDTSSNASCPPRQHRSDQIASEIVGGVSDGSGPTVKGKGAELFAKRQTRMEKFVVDAKTVRSNKPRLPSPTLSMPCAWKYSSIIRAPLSGSYNPIVSPSYPPAAQKRSAVAVPTSPKADKDNRNPPPKAMSVMDVMKHQPYRLDSSLFNPSPTSSPNRPSASSQARAELPAVMATPSGPVSVPNLFTHQAKSFPAQTPHIMHDGPGHRSFSSCFTPVTSTASTFVAPSSSPLTSEMIARCALPIAPRPKFCAKKAPCVGKQWRRVVMQH